MSDLYVSPSGSDSNNGSASAPFQTIAAAAAAATPGTTINVAPGNYAGGFTTSASGTAGAPITFVSTVPGGAHIVGGGTASDAMAWWNTGNNVVVQGFDIDGSGSQAASWRMGFYNSGSNVTFQNNTVHDILSDPSAFAAASSSGMGGAGIEMDGYSGGSSGSVIGNTVYNIGPSGVQSSLVHGIYQVESGTVANNVVYNVVGNGVTSWHGSDNINIINNTIDNARDGGIFVGSGDGGATSTSGDYFTVENNIITDSAWGIAEGGTTGVHNTYTDNLLYGNTQNTITLQNGLTATGTIIANPDFVNQAAHDYHLQSNSPAIGAGTLSGAPATDIDGVPRNGKDDLGAYDPPAGSTSATGQTSAAATSSTSDPTGTTSSTTTATPTSTATSTSDPTQTAGSTSTATPTPTPGATPTPTPTATPTPTPTFTSTTVNVPSNQGDQTITADNTTINATGGNHMFFISGNTDTFKLSGGIETITDSGSGGNTFTVPAAGDSKLVFTNSVLDNQDTLDLSATLANTQWDGSASSLESYLHVQEVHGNTRLSVSNTPNGPQTSVAVFQDQNVALSTILAHSIT